MSLSYQLEAIAALLSEREPPVTELGAGRVSEPLRTSCGKVCAPGCMKNRFVEPLLTVLNDLTELILFNRLLLIPFYILLTQLRNISKEASKVMRRRFSLMIRSS